MHPILLKIDGFALHTYGVLVASGYLAAILYMQRRLKVLSLTEDEFWRLIYGLLAGAILGGKLFYLIAHSQESSLAENLRNFRYGFVFYGGLLGAGGAGWVWCRLKKRSFLAEGDYWAPAVALGHAIGRLGCLAAGCCYGAPTALPWGVRFSSPDSLVPDRFLGAPLHPSQLYESLGNLALFAALHLRFVPRRRAGEAPPGAAALFYAAGYSVLRFAVEATRGDDRGFRLGPLSISQAVSLAVLAAAGAAAWRLKRGEAA